MLQIDIRPGYHLHRQQSVAKYLATGYRTGLYGILMEILRTYFVLGRGGRLARMNEVALQGELERWLTRLGLTDQCST